MTAKKLIAAGPLLVALAATLAAAEPPAKTAKLADLAPRNKKEAAALAGVKVTGLAVIDAVEFDAADPAARVVTAYEASHFEAGQPIQWRRDRWTQTKLTFTTPADAARDLAKGRRVELSGDVAAAELKAGLDLIGNDRKGKDRVLSLRLARVLLNE